ncbi:unnamed protein product [Nezara viridula]|uniref:Uncharacterized protein n=1 Tax=Nezara viridula TaxID=85310 RepID=A0A9P0E5P2_NEZVI|nr:unnamed protein product [Nezara viridula]
MVKCSSRGLRACHLRVLELIREEWPLRLNLVRISGSLFRRHRLVTPVIELTPKNEDFSKIRLENLPMRDGLSPMLFSIAMEMIRTSHENGEVPIRMTFAQQGKSLEPPQAPLIYDNDSRVWA